MVKKRKISEIRKKVSDGTARVMTAQELLDGLSNGQQIGFDDVDIITTGTKGLYSGLAGIFSFAMCPPKTVKTFKDAWINGIPTFVGPCPNESLGEIDVMLFGTRHSIDDEKYGGGFLFRELVERKPVKVVATTDTGERLEKTLTLDDMKFARLLGTRQVVKNYNALINISSDTIHTIFSVLPLEPYQLSFCGCGALNPLENDPSHKVLGVGSPILVNGKIGHIIGPGTRNNVSKPNLMSITDFKGMKPEYMGGFMTSSGPESVCSVAMAIPIISEDVWNGVVKSDKTVSLNIVNVNGRDKLAEITYGDVWDRNYTVSYNVKKCIDCTQDCSVPDVCPTHAFTFKKGIDKTRCFNCGTCVRICKQGAFLCDLKKVKFQGREVPVCVRQSDRSGATKIAIELKGMILRGEFPIMKPTGELEFYSSSH